MLSKLLWICTGPKFVMSLCLICIMLFLILNAYANMFWLKRVYLKVGVCKSHFSQSQTYVKKRNTKTTKNTYVLLLLILQSCFESCEATWEWMRYIWFSRRIIRHQTNTDIHDPKVCVMKREKWGQPPCLDPQFQGAGPWVRSCMAGFCVCLLLLKTCGWFEV